MAMSCASCNYYTPEYQETCPKCSTRLRMTFLPPPTAVTEPVVMPAPLAPGTPSYPMPGFRGSYDLFEIILRNRFVAFLVSIPLIGLGFWFADLTSDGGPRAKYKAIRVGMTAEQVHEILYSDSRFSPEVRRISTTGDAQMTWTEGPIRITVYFRNGRVVNKRIAGAEDIEDLIISSHEAKW